VIEQDQNAAERAKAAGLPVIYGDASSPVVLEAAGIHEARLALVVVSAAIDVDLIVRAVRQLSPRLHVVARATQRSQIEHLYRFGVHEIVQPEFEAGIELVRQSLLHFDIPATEIERLSDAVRAEHYQAFTTLDTDAQVLALLRRTRQSFDIGWYTLAEGAPLAGLSIRASDIRQRTGALVVAVLRSGAILANPEPELVFEPGDGVGIVGTPEQRLAFQAWAVPPAMLEPESEQPAKLPVPVPFPHANAE
jgi:CPA2 family monovalent cation:H+ antiporter-2